MLIKDQVPRWVRVFGVLLVFAFPIRADADPEDCQAAINGYNSAISDVSTALRSYAQCVSSSHAHDDCSGEFATLQTVQSDFEEAVSAYGSDCQ